MTPNILMVTSAAIVGLLGLGHVSLTLGGTRLLPRDPSLKAAMERDTLVITRQTSVWRAWLGFNISHGMGAMLFALAYAHLAIAHGDVLFNSIFLQAVGLTVLLSYMVLAKLYWFTTPLVAVSVSLTCYTLAVALSWTSL